MRFEQVDSDTGIYRTEDREARVVCGGRYAGELKDPTIAYVLVSCADHEGDNPLAVYLDRAMADRMLAYFTAALPEPGVDWYDIREVPLVLS